MNRARPMAARLKNESVKYRKLDVGVLFVKVVVKSVNFVFVNGGKSVVNVS